MLREGCSGSMIAERVECSTASSGRLSRSITNGLALVQTCGQLLLQEKRRLAKTQKQHRMCSSRRTLNKDRYRSRIDHGMGPKCKGHSKETRNLAPQHKDDDSLYEK
ncbi:hypothetical protein KIN20_032640 [Parelaphostrongylus tenuis]|uniref:Uncharacterized protein n=1 Tax=Parelaphostrongylus tenuis TaxID=148309 RepID=A0AAD5R724_PARTN|nr:hypothetical protein KIN20_032640 [Parelaphostrongylus tenuis]